ncbi:heavy-metal-associated domain-containing protein [Novosphingobium album (ex Liu et al. 2023)]|uniref:Heavy-metal-associated domain-containing protein n=1 Tax=Novosphingobium album (ex Liu et al. 2023) TaxID=3031130 RepID=A0ABT5WTN2_9SPHN|nr:heavy-metal-associated domain-containing protein [Novosphingobium album (ex Liu et al. 2023)]MDE8653248.1 heavy-metal-associated domain-containing protein [Novosphingobium album (ex Liu et al. 2023)]
MANPSDFPRPRFLKGLRPGPAAQLLLALGAGLCAALAVIGPDRLIAQIEGDRGIPPIANSDDIQVSGIDVETTGKTGEEARAAGWKLAQRKAWEKLSGPQMSDEQIDALVSAVVIEREQIGPHRYIARLGVIFDRARAGQFVGRADGGGLRARSAPLLVIPVLYSGGVRQVFEVRGPWQRAWANFQTAQSSIDYVRPAGSGGESLILTAGQPGRRSRLWWRNILDQFEAADVLIPVARLERQWPGGPVRGTFTARYGPDNTFLESFTLTASDEQAVPRMLDQAMLRIDGIYQRALAQGVLTPDPSLLSGQMAFDRAIEQLRARLLPREAALAGEAGEGPLATGAPLATPSQTGAPAAIASVTVQFATPDAAAVDSALAAVRGIAGVQGAATTSLAIGGTSVMRVTVAGGGDALAAALRAQGWQVTGGGGTIRISR